MCYFAGGSKTYEEVARKANLTPKMAARYLAYMRARWAIEEETHCLCGYAGEWALRFKDGVEVERSDDIGRSVLQSIN